MTDKPLTEKDIYIEANFEIEHKVLPLEKVQSAKRLLKKLLIEQMESQEELFIALEFVDACFQIPDGDYNQEAAKGGLSSDAQTTEILRNVVTSKPPRKSLKYEYPTAYNITDKKGDKLEGEK